MKKILIILIGIIMLCGTGLFAGWFGGGRVLPAKTIAVATSGGDYTTIQEAITAAISAGASLSTPYSVVYYPGVENTYTPDKRVIVSPAQVFNSIKRSWSTDIVGEKPLERIQTPYNCGLIALRIDDADTSLFTTSSVLRLPNSTIDRSPIEYAAKMGIPLTLAVPGKYAETETAGYLTRAQFRKAVWDYGAELASHSQNHGNDPNIVTPSWSSGNSQLTISTIYAGTDILYIDDVELVVA